MNQKPTVGRAVHYYLTAEDRAEYKGPYAATISKVCFHDGEIWTVGPHGMCAGCHLKGPFPCEPRFNLHVLIQDAHFPVSLVLSARYAETPTPGCWSWPPKV